MFYTQKSAPQLRAFTLIELLASLAIISILVAILTVGIQRAKIMTNTTLCASKLRELAQLSNLQANDNGGWVPQARWYDETKSARPNLRDYGMSEELIQCPATDLPKSYGININLVAGGSSQWGPSDIQYWKRGRFRIFELSPTQTLLFMDTFATTTGYYLANAAHADYRHNHQAQAVFLDGHIEQVEPTELLDPDILKRGLPLQ